MKLVDEAPIDLPALRTRRQDRLGLLCVVLRTRFRCGDPAPVSRSALRRALREFEVPRRTDALHALLRVVSHQGPAAMGTAWQSQALYLLQMGHRARVLELLRLVSRTGGTKDFA